MPQQRRLIVATAVAATIAAVTLAGAALAQAAHSTARRPAVTATGGTNYGTTPSYRLIDQRGRQFSSAQLRGEVQIISYLFPYCTSYCPLIARNLALAEKLIDRHGLRGKVAFVAFNVDPGGADPQVLGDFLRQEGIDPNDPAWHYLTGTAQQVAHVVRDGFHVYYQKVTLAQEQEAEAQQKHDATYQPQPDEPNEIASRAHVDYDIVHNDTVEIADGTGKIRTFFDSGDTTSPQQLYRAAVRAVHPDH